MLVCSYLDVSFYKPDGTFDKSYYTYNPGTIRPNDALTDKEGILWVADNDQGLWSIGNDWIGTSYMFNGPASPDVAAMDITGKQLWAVPGGKDGSYGSLYKAAQFYTLADGTWNNFSKDNIPELATMRDVLCVATDPQNGNHAFLGSWGYGLLEADNGALKEIYTPGNSSLQYMPGFGMGYLRIGGVAFDENNNLSTIILIAVPAR